MSVCTATAGSGLVPLSHTFIYIYLYIYFIYILFSESILFDSTTQFAFDDSFQFDNSVQFDDSNLVARGVARGVVARLPRRQSVPYTIKTELN